MYHHPDMSKIGSALRSILLSAVVFLVTSAGSAANLKVNVLRT